MKGRKATGGLICRILRPNFQRFSLPAKGYGDQYFDGECILFKDAVEKLDMQTTIVQALVAVADSALIESGHSELTTDSDKLRKLVSERALKKAGYIVALAKSEMLVDFGEGAAANAVLKPYVLKAE